MQDLHIQGSNKTPSVDFLVNGDLKIEGRSIPENSHEFYKPLVDWVDEWQTSLPLVIKLTVKLEYINTSSSKVILDLFKRLDGFHSLKKADTEIIWMYDYDDDDSRDEGYNYKSELTVPFLIKPY